MRLSEVLARIDGRGYAAYRELAGRFAYPEGELVVERVQADPFAPPSRVSFRLAADQAGFPPELFATASRRVALADYLARRAARVAQNLGREGRGRVVVDCGGQEVLPRNSLRVEDDGAVRLRCAVELPARGRTVLGRRALRLLEEDLRGRVVGSLRYAALPREELARWVYLADDRDFLRGELERRGWVAFVPDGAVLPRESGRSQRPMSGAVAFSSPPELAATVRLPRAGPVRGMALPRGVTLLIGGGFHGKSTLLSALERGVYDHVPDDGRELLATDRDAVKVRTEDGRRVTRVDLSAFLTRLPGGVETADFATESASGSTSQAANILEALELGARVLLLDEDKSAGNFLVRDALMQRVVAKDHEPITPFVDRVRPLWEERGVSTVLALGGCGDYFAVADRVVLLEDYRPRDATREARAAAAAGPARRSEASGFPAPVARVPRRRGDDPGRRVSALGADRIRYGREEVDLSFLDQLVDPGQTRAVADILRRFDADGRRPLREVLEEILAEVAADLDRCSPQGVPGDYALPRLYELGAAWNRLPDLAVAQLLR